MNDIIWQNCSEYSSRAEILIAHMGNCISVLPSSQTCSNNTFAVRVIALLPCQHAQCNTANTCVRNTRGKWIKNLSEKFEQYCVVLFCVEYLIFTAWYWAACLPARGASTPKWEQKIFSLQSIPPIEHFSYDISISVRFLMIFPIIILTFSINYTPGKQKSPPEAGIN